MSLYTETYNQALHDAQTKYKKLHNLYLLKSLRQKINCFKSHSPKPDEYYDCFFEIEGNMLRQSQEFTANCDQIDVNTDFILGLVQDLPSRLQSQLCG